MASRHLGGESYDVTGPEWHQCKAQNDKEIARAERNDAECGGGVEFVRPVSLKTRFRLRLG